MSIFDIVQNQLLGMKWLSDFVAAVLGSAGVDIKSPLGGSLHFFIYDLIKITILLAILIFIISYIQSYFPPERTKRILGGFKGIYANILGALLGTITPFCSCSSIPLFIGFTRAGLPVGVTFSFLISSPLVDLGAFILLTSVFGFKIAVVYVVVGIVLAVVGGAFIEKMKPEKYLDASMAPVAACASNEGELLSTADRFQFAKTSTLWTVKKVWPYIFIGVAVGAVIHNWLPQELIEKVLGGGNPFSVIIATLVGIPIYADIFGTIPIAEALYYKGAGLGTILSFMMAVTALSLPSLIMLSKVIKPKLLAIFAGITAFGIILIGYIFNALGPLFG